MIFFINLPILTISLTGYSLKTILHLIWRFEVRKIKVYLTLTAIAACMLAFTGCGTENNNETGSNTDTQRNNESTGVIEEAVTGVIDGVEGACDRCCRWILRILQQMLPMDLMR